MGALDPHVVNHRSGPPEMTGPAVHATLSGEDRRRFGQEFCEALGAVTATLDIEPLNEVVRRWWVFCGGDRGVAQADRLAAHGPDLRRLADTEQQMAVTPLHQTILDGEGTSLSMFGVPFREAFRHAVADAAVTLDHLPLRYLLQGYAGDRGDPVAPPPEA
ncbi:DUF6247 family protein [Embleya sp. NBC_00888]|uniref:DUF6247 family protein n=1 Tax=Embleya sp. NBC_00888 TaxID=2975960 RepID=UPI003868AC2A|nr:DUF6247 family protein [Embleya sp. NBC_00888]